MPSLQRISLHYNNLYVVDGGGLRLLIDTGPDFRGAWESIQEQLGRRAPDLVIATHGHLDHAGLGRQWQASGIPVAIHPDDVHLVTNTQLQSVEEFEAMARFARKSGAPPEVVERAVTGLQDRRRWAHEAATKNSYPPATRNGRWPTGLRYKTFTPRQDLPEACALLDRAGLEAHHMPGHTPGNIVLTCPTEGWLFSGDQLLPVITPTPAIQFVGQDHALRRFRSLPEFVASMERIDGAAAGECFPGHGEPFQEVHQAIRRNLDGIAERTERVLLALREAGRATVFDLCEAIYPRAARRRFWQVIATIQGNLDIAEARGAVILNGIHYELAR